MPSKEKEKEEHLDLLQRYDRPRFFNSLFSAYGRFYGWSNGGAAA